MRGISAEKFSEIIARLIGETPIVDDPEEFARFKLLSGLVAYRRSSLIR
jgi:hypothetical protein